MEKNCSTCGWSKPHKGLTKKFRRNMLACMFVKKSEMDIGSMLKRRELHDTCLKWKKDREIEESSLTK